MQQYMNIEKALPKVGNMQQSYQNIDAQDNGRRYQVHSSEPVIAQGKYIKIVHGNYMLLYVNYYSANVNKTLHFYTYTYKFFLIIFSSAITIFITERFTEVKE